MKLHFLKYINESKDRREIRQEKLKFDRDQLSPVMSEQTLKYHYDGLASKYFDRYNAGEGDPDFNYGGAMLHNIFFANLAEPRAANKPDGASQTIINELYGSFDDFKKEFEKSAMGIKGSGWAYMDTSGEIKTISNHEYRDSMKISLLVDWWEHAWALDYQQDKAGYLKNIWRIIDWDVVNIRLSV